MSATSIHRPLSIIGKLYLVIGLTVLGMTVAYFALPAGLIKRGQADLRFAERHEDFRHALARLDRAVLISRLYIRSAPIANSGPPVDFVGAMAHNSRLRVEACRAEIEALIQPDRSLGFAPLVQRLNGRIEAFLAQVDSPATLEGILLVTAQMNQLSARTVELRAEMAAHDATLDNRSMTSLLVVALVGIAVASVLIVRSIQINLRTLEATINQRNEQAVVLQHEHDFSARLTKMAPAIILVLDPAGVIQHANPFFEQLTGWSLAEVRGREWFATCLPLRDHDRIRTLFQAATHNVPTRGNINAILTRSGDEREIEWSANALHDAAGGLTGVLAVGIDVTERQRANEALRANEARTRQILDGLFGFVGVFTLDGTLIDANDAPLRAAGLRREDVLGCPFWTTYWWSYDARVQAELQAALARAGRGEIVRYEPVVRIQDGALITIDVTFGPMRNAAGEITQILGFGVDITERKKVAAALAASEARLRATIDTAPVPMALNDAAHRITYLNRSFIQTYGYELQDIPTLADWWPKAYPDPAYRQRVADAWQAELTRSSETGTSLIPAEVKIRCKDGSERFALASASQLHGEFADTNVVVLLDITDRKQAEAALRMGETRLRTILESEPECVKLVDADCNLLDMNPAGLRMIAAGSLDQVRGVSILDLLAPDFRQSFRDGVAAVFRGESKLQVFEIIDLTGSRHWMEQHAVPLFEPEQPGRVKAMLAVTRDITDRKRAEAQRLETESKLQVVMENLADGFFIMDRDWRYLEINPAGARMVGKPREELLGRRYTEAFPEAAGTVWEKTYAHVIATGESATIEAYNEPLATWFEAKVYPFAGGIAGLFSNITARKQTETALRTSTAQLNQAQRIARMGSWDLNLGTNKLQWSEEIFRLFEIDPAKFGATYEAFLRVVHPDDREAVNATYAASLRDRQPYRITHRLLMADGRIKFVEEQCETDFAPDGTPIESRGTVQDVTERVITEQKIRRSLQEKETLLREIHHRVKNNLQIVSSLLYFHSKKVHDTPALTVFGDVRDRLRAMMLVHEKLYRSEDLTRVDFADYVRSLVVLLTPSGINRGRFHLKMELALLALPIESALPCGMILVELLTNIIKHAFPDERGGEVLVQLAVADGWVRLSVGDDGVGLPPGFDPDTADSLGWQLIRNLTVQLGSTTTIERVAGTRVTVLFPLAAAGGAASNAPGTAVL